MPLSKFKQTWFVIDAKDFVLGRLASQVAQILQGKHRPYYSPQYDHGDFVIITNAEKVAVTGQKEQAKIYYHHSGFPGGLKAKTLSELRQQKPEELIKKAVKGMLPKNRLARQMIKKLYVYTGSEHPHRGKEPKVLELTK